jgi:hypothetical protein
VLTSSPDDLVSDIFAASSGADESKSLNTAITAAAGVTVATLIVAAIFYMLRSTVERTKVIGPSSGAHQPLSKNGSAPPPIHRKAVSFVNPAYANVVGTDGLEAYAGAFPPAVSSADEEHGYLKVTEEEVDPNRGYLDVGDETGTPDSPRDTFSISIANPLFISNSPPSSPDGSHVGGFLAVSSKITPTKRAQSVNQVEQVSKPTLSMRNTKAPITFNPKVTPAVSIKQPTFPIMRVSPPPQADDDTCTFLLNCQCTSCVGED